MKMISKLGGGALIMAMAISAVGCSKSGASIKAAGKVAATSIPSSLQKDILILISE